MGIRQRREQNGIDHRVDGCSRSNAKHQSGNHCSRQAQILAQHPQAVAKIPDQNSHVSTSISKNHFWKLSR
jgi:hypothetical protein